jgi:hypothetical protein
VVELTLLSAALTLALPFVPGVAQWFEFVRPLANYYRFVLLVTLSFLAMIEAVKRFFLALITPPSRQPLGSAQRRVRPKS